MLTGVMIRIIEELLLFNLFFPIFLTFDYIIIHVKSEKKIIKKQRITP